MAAETGLNKEKYYHGLLPREDIKVLLQKPGDFIVRMSEPTLGQGARSFILSVQSETEQKHFVIHKSVPEGKFYIDQYSFPSIQELVTHYVKAGESVAKGGSSFLRNPIPRQRWELNHEDVTSTKKLGEGAFGEVHLGIWKTHAKRGDIKVAIKLAKLDNMTKEQIKEFMREARLMRIFECDYVVRIWGVAAASEPLMLVMELASNGSLNSYLEKNQLDDNQKALMCVQSSWGIEYLHTKNIIHRDIAARNCLYGDNKVKIADFGMSREGPVYQMDPKRRVPIRWLAPETMRVQTYTFKTDVYSYGIMAWEIYHNGKEPFPGMTPGEVAKHVQTGGRMEFEVMINPDIKMVICNNCWSDDPSERLTQEQISRKMEQIAMIPRPDFEGDARKRREADAEEAREAAAAAAAHAASGQVRPPPLNIVPPPGAYGSPMMPAVPTPVAPAAAKPKAPTSTESKGTEKGGDKKGNVSVKNKRNNSKDKKKK